MTSETTIRFRNGDIELDGRLALPGGAATSCVVCHPHPLYGGDMGNGVVVAIVRALGAAGIATLRFDFRGVGASGGTHAGGSAEVEDARAAVDALAAASGLARVAIAGYSFGSLIALRLAADHGVCAVAAVAPPLAMFDAGFAARIEAPMLVLAGDRDTFCPREQFDALAARLPADARARQLPGADHFFAGFENDVGQAVADWLSGT